jgi:hypothetical protein
MSRQVILELLDALIKQRYLDLRGPCVTRMGRKFLDYFGLLCHSQRHFGFSFKEIAR